MGYILGLDIGPTSIGWAAVTTDDKGDPVGFEQLATNGSPELREVAHPALGVRIFSAGVDNMGQGQREEPKNAKRREKRSIRRRLRRARARRRRLVALLIKHGLIPADEQLLQDLQHRDPYGLRVRAMKEKIELAGFARILLHFAKRRGFQSNRRVPEKDAKASEMRQARERLVGELQGQTVGQFWHEKLKINPHECIRNRMGQYKWIGQRDQYRDELAQVWQTQAGFYPEVLCHSFYEEVRAVLFDQIDFELSERKKKRLVGMCSLIAGQRRCPWADRLAQRFRLLQKINDLEIKTASGSRALSVHERERLVRELSVRKQMTFDQIGKAISERRGEPLEFNLEYIGNDGLKGNEIDALLAGSVFFGKKAWLRLGENNKDQVWSILEDVLTQTKAIDVAAREIESEYGLAFGHPDWHERLHEPTGYCNLSRAALQHIIPWLEQGFNLHEAIQRAGLKKTWTKRELLPLPDRSHGFQITNPIVQTVLFQIRKVVNLLVKENGPPEAIVVEMAREVKATKDRRQEIMAQQTLNRREREQCEARIREMHGWSDDVSVSSADILKYRLWEQQNHYCPYSCRQIPQTALFSRDVEIDHILPYSMSLDNTQNNLVVCYSAENQAKGQNTPISWLGEESPKWRHIQDAMNRNAFGFSDFKWERFSVRSEEIAEKYQPERLLRDTSYIAAIVREYLQLLYPPDKAAQRVRTIKGGITAELRNLWGLNAILREGEPGPKKRDDLRHHAIDAAVIATTSPGVIHKVTGQLQRDWPRCRRRANVDEPWSGFGIQLHDAIRGMGVSHRVERRLRGALHEETNYHKEMNGENAGKYVTRKPIQKLTESTVDGVCDTHIRTLLKKRIAETPGRLKEVLRQPLLLPNAEAPDHPVPVRKVRIAVPSSTMVQLNEHNWVEPGSNHHVEIFRIIEAAATGGKYAGKLVRRIYTTWEVAERLRKSRQAKAPVQGIISRCNPDPALFAKVEFLMSLSAGECVLLRNSEGLEVLARVVKMSYGTPRPDGIDILFVEHQVARVEGTPTKSTPHVYRVRSMREFAERVVRKVTIDPLGRIRRAND